MAASPRDQVRHSTPEVSRPVTPPERGLALARRLHVGPCVVGEYEYRALLVSNDDRLLGLLENSSSAGASGPPRAGEALAPVQLNVATATGAEDAVQLMRARDYDAVVLDLDSDTLPDEPLSVCADLYARWPETPIVVISEDDRVESPLAAMRAGAYDYVRRPLSQERLDAALRRVFRRRDLHRQIDEIAEGSVPSRGLEDFIGESPVIDAVAAVVMKAARSDVTVLITGESGTGKELVARSIHRHGVRSGGPFVPVNCGALPPDLLESELFGHTKGAYTDANKDRQGLFVQANGGTILLDEVADMSIELQAKLLRVLQERSVRPVGGEAEIPIDARIIAATNQDLEKRVAAHQFREDLFYRLNVVRISVPPLRARGNDIILLAEHMRHAAASRLGKPTRSISPDAIRLLLNYSWPGNVRELENAIERAVAMSKSDAITPGDLPAAIREHPMTSSAKAIEDLQSLPSLAEIENAHIQHTLESVDGNKTRAADILGIDRRTIYRRLQSSARSEPQ